MKTKFMFVLGLCFLLNSCTEWLDNYGCGDFRPVKNIADLIQQMYSHVDKKCLYQHNGSALSKKLGVAVINQNDFSDNEAYHNYNELLKKRDCQTELDGVIVYLGYSKDRYRETHKGTIELKECHRKKYGGLEKNTDWLSKLPPMKEEQLVVSHCFAEDPDEFVGNYVPPIFKACHEYSWPQKGNGKMTLDVYGRSNDLGYIGLQLD